MFRFVLTSGKIVVALERTLRRVAVTFAFRRWKNHADIRREALEKIESGSGILEQVRQCVGSEVACGLIPMQWL